MPELLQVIKQRISKCPSTVLPEPANYGLTLDRKKGRFGSMTTGKVKWFSDTKGYGFIATDEGKDVFVHYSAIRGAGHRNLYEGQEVEFEVTPGPRGPQAADVQPL